MQSDSNAGNFLPLLFLGLMVYSIAQSKRKLRTVLYSICGLLGGGLAMIAMSLVFPNANQSAIGAAAVDLALLTAALVGLIHSRITRKGPVGTVPNDAK